MLKIVVSFCLFLTGAGSLHASLIDNDRFTTDTTSGLDWLDLTFSTGFSYNELVTETNPGGLFEEYRLATVAEVDTLFLTAGLPPSGNDTRDFVAVNSLIDLVGATAFQDSNPESIGITSTPGPTFGHQVAGLDFFLDSGVPTYTMIDGLVYGDTFGPDTVGGWLVRESMPVPAPPLFVLLAFGLTGLLVGYQKRSID